MQLNTIQCGDCLDVLKNIPNDSFDLSFADPPFNLKKDYAEYDDRMAEEKYLDWCKLWMAEMVRVTKPTGSLLIHNIPRWLIKYASYLDDVAIFRHWIVWDASSGPMGQSLQPNHYGILYYVLSNGFKVNPLRTPNKRCRLKSCGSIAKDWGGKKHNIHPFGSLLGDVWSDIHRWKHTPRSDQFHPCYLPLHLLERIVLLCTDEGDSVFDPFVGTGTTMLAAKRLGRRYFGIELSQEYVDFAERQLKDQPLSQLNGIWLSCHLNKIHTARSCDIMDGKDFRPEWKALWKEWPETKEQRRRLNEAELILKPEYMAEIKRICEKSQLHE